MRAEPQNPNWSLERIADRLETEDNFTLRDFFAGCALIGCILKDDLDVSECPVAYAMADAMLKAREAK